MLYAGNTDLAREDTMTLNNPLLVEDMTERELDILNGLMRGLTNQEIANELHLALKTVKWYNTQIYNKLGVNNRQEAIAQAQQRNLIAQEKDLPNNLPAQVSSFIGRKQDLEQLKQLLRAPDIRLVTIAGVGGMGKTQLSLEVGRQLLREFDDGIFLIKLAPLSSTYEIPDAMAQVFLHPQSGNTLDELMRSLTRFLGTKSMLIIFDNFEHLLPDGAQLVTQILEDTPNVKVLTTSRERLKLGSETVFATSGLAVPVNENATDALDTDAVALFMQNVRKVRPDFEPNADELQSIIRICQLTDGMPLAIVLAAAWVGTLSFAEIAEELQFSVDLLSVEIHDLPKRQWSIHAVFESTWKRLTPKEQAVFMKFSRFRGGATRHAAQSVTGATPRTLMSLINTSLLWRDIQTGRYEMHEVLRQYAAEKLGESSFGQEAETAYAMYFIQFMAERLDALKRDPSPAFVDEILVEWDNIVHALFAEWVWHPDNVDIVRNAMHAIMLVQSDINPREIKHIIALLEHYLNAHQLNTQHPVWHMLRAGFLPYDEASIREVKTLLDQSISDGNPRDIAWFYECYACLLHHARQDLAGAQREYNHALAIYEELGDLHAIGQTQLAIGWAAAHDYDVNIPAHLHALECFKAVGNQTKIAHAYIELAYAYAFTKADLVEGIRYGELGLETALKAGSKLLTLYSHVFLGWAAALTGNLDEVRYHAEICLQNNDGFYHDVVRTHPLVQMSFLASMVDGDYEKALRLAEQARELVTHPTGDAYLQAKAVALLGLDQLEEAAACLQVWFSRIWDSALVGGISILALLMARRNRLERAAELLGFVDHYPLPSGHYEQWHLAIRIRQEIREQLGEEAFLAAHERGKHFELLPLAAELVDEF